MANILDQLTKELSRLAIWKRAKHIAIPLGSKLDGDTGVLMTEPANFGTMYTIKFSHKPLNLHNTIICIIT